MNKLQQLIIESVNEYMKAIEAAGEMAGHKSKMEAAKEAIEKRDITKTLNKLEEEEKMMIDEKKVKEMANERKALEKYLAKLQKQLDKLESKLDKAPKVEEEEEKEIVDETMMDENDPENGPQLEEEYDTNIYEMLHMQKLAGVISESEYKVKVEEAKKKKASAGMTKKEKSEVAKKARAGKDIGKKGKGFEDVAKAAGGGEKGKKIAAAAMWKGEAKKAKSLKEEVLALFENELSEDSKKIYGIEKGNSPYDFGPYTYDEAEAKAQEYQNGDRYDRYEVILYNDLRNMLPAIERMQTPKLDKDGKFEDTDSTPFSQGDLADY